MACLGGDDADDEARGRDGQGLGEACYCRDDWAVELDALVIEDYSGLVSRCACLRRHRTGLTEKIKNAPQDHAVEHRQDIRRNHIPIVEDALVDNGL